MSTSIHPTIKRLIAGSLTIPSALAALAATSCSEGGNGLGTGGSAASSAGGGSESTGGASASGGTITGGSMATGGTPSGGAVSTGGSTPTTGGTPGNTGGSSGGSPQTTGGASSGGTSSGGSGGVLGDGGANQSGGTSGSGGSTQGGYNPDFVEDYGADCEVAEPVDTNTHMLPDPFMSMDGTRMSSLEDWRCQRANLKKVVEKYIHGVKPGRPDVVAGAVTETNGTVTISVHVEHDGQSGDFELTGSIPENATRPAPAVIGLGNVSSMGTPNMAETIRDEGVATFGYGHNALSSESSASGIFVDFYGANASAQVGWAWGLSRVIDVLVDERDAGRNDLIDPTAIGVTGCSRNGKGAFTIGAFDERIALGIPQESGTAGVSALRIVNEGMVGPNEKPTESLSASVTAGPRWFGTDFRNNYINKVDTIPGDMHFLVAMYAPRGLLVLDNSRIGELGSVAQHAASMAGGEVFKALGVESHVAYHGGNPNDPHNHCAFYPSQVEPLQRAIRGHLTGGAPPDGRMEPQPVATATLSEWIDWETPTLE